MKIKCLLFGHKFKPDFLIELIEQPLTPYYFPVSYNKFNYKVNYIDAQRCEHCGHIERG